MSNTSKTLKPSDFASDQLVRWCPGCGDYAILNAVKKVLAASGKHKEEIAFISGIGCSSRFPYYVDTYGMHGIHGRAAAIASGLTVHNPSLSVWVITGDGDGLAIGGNHFIHCIRRNMDFNFLLFNNEIYGLTKGQYSPTSKLGSTTQTSPTGTIEQPLSAAKLAIGAGATFFARAAANDPKHLEAVIQRANKHRGTSIVEIMQNCVIFNDKAFDQFLDKSNRDQKTIKPEHGTPLTFGEEEKYFLALQGGMLEIYEKGLSDKVPLVHNEQDQGIAFMLAQLEEVMPLGVFYCVDSPTYSDRLEESITAAKDQKPYQDMQALLNSGDTWQVG